MLTNFTRVTVVHHTYSTVARVVDSCSYDTLYHSRRNDRDREQECECERAIMLLNVHLAERGRYRRRCGSCPGAEHNVSFVEFVRFLTDSRLDDYRRFNAHWAPVSDLCRPCRVHYDYVIKLEQFDTEAFQLWKALYGESAPVVPTAMHRNALAVRTSFDVTAKYLRQLSRQQVLRLQRLYADDFRLFGYNTDIYGGLT